MVSHKKPAFLLLFLLITFGSVSAVLFTPALPQISHFFGVNSGTAQLTITLFLVGYAVGQLLYGPLANGFGRKVALYIGIALEIVASLLCVLSAELNAFWLLVIGRLLMALGASVGLKMCFTIVADAFTPEQSIAIISHLMIAFAITPALGITIGGFLTEHLNWQSCFYFLAIYGVFLFYLVTRMPETAPVIDRSALKIEFIVKKYSQAFNYKTLLLSALVGCGTAFVYVFAATAPFVAIQQMHLRPSVYGLWNLLPPVGFLLGSQLSAQLSKKIATMRAIILGLCIMILGVLLLLTAFTLQFFSALGLFLPLTIIYIGTSFIFANASSLTMQLAEDKSSTSAVMNFINVGTATFIVLIVGLLHTESILLLPITFTIITLCALVFALSYLILSTKNFQTK